MGCGASKTAPAEPLEQQHIKKERRSWFGRKRSKSPGRASKPRRASKIKTDRIARIRLDGTKQLRELPHSKALISPYQGGTERLPVPPDKIRWKVKWPDYAPVEFTHAVVLKGPPWADKPDVTAVEFNVLDMKARIDRSSFEGAYNTDKGTNRPMNPRGRTGMTGRGLLGRFGPNHAADPVITKWRRDADGTLELDEHGQKILEFVAVKRKDTGDWAIPGGMVDAGETVSLTLKREFGEETMDSLNLPIDERRELHAQLDQVFKRGLQVYSGYVDDVRNTDNAWMETTCVNFHDEDGSSFSKFSLKAGDDAGQVAWARYEKGMPLYATHTHFLGIVAAMHGAK